MMEKRRVIKNVVIYSTCVVLFVTASNPVRQLQSSLNIHHGLGTTSISVGYLGSTLSFFALPSLVAGILGHKWTITICIFVVSLCIPANIYASWYTLLPANIVASTVAGIGKASQNALCAELADAYALSSNIPRDKVYSVMLGLGSTLSNSGLIWGSVISSEVLKYFKRYSEENSTFVYDGDSKCGARFEDREFERSSVFLKPSTGHLAFLFGCFTSIGILSSVLCGLFLDATPVKKVETKEKLACKTFKLFRDPKCFLLFANDFHRGLVKPFVESELTKAFVTCLLGVSYVGLFMMAYGITLSLFCLLFGVLSNYVGRITVNVFVATLEIGLLLLTTSDRDQTVWAIFTMALAWGIVSAGQDYTFKVLHGKLFPSEEKDASYAIYLLGENAGSMVENGYSSSLSVLTKIYILFVCSLLSFICYLFVEIPLFLKERMRVKSISKE